jgi:chaperone protein dnaK
VKDVYLVGGACSFEDSEKIFAKELGLNIHKPYMPLYITPIGIALAGLKD